MVTTLAPCWYCCGLIVQFRIGTVVIGESRTFKVGRWLRERGVVVVDLDCFGMRGLAYNIHHETIPTSGTKTSAKVDESLSGACPKPHGQTFQTARMTMLLLRSS